MLAQLIVVALFTTGALAVAQMLIGSVDDLSDFVSRNANADLQAFLNDSLGRLLSTSLSPVTAAVPSASTPPLAFVFVSAVLVLSGGILIWLELLARTLVIYAVLLFFPLVLATAIWPRLTHLLHRYVELLMAVIVAKLIIVVIVAAGVAAIAVTGQQDQGPSLLMGSGMLLIAAWAPWKLYRLLPLMEAGVAHHNGAPFQSGWSRVRSGQWRESASRWATRGSRGAGTLPIAGRNRGGRPPGPPRGGTAAPQPRPGGRPGGPGSPAAGGPSATPRPQQQPPPPGSPAWQERRVSGGGRLWVPGDRVRNPRRLVGGMQPGGAAGG